MIWIYRNERFSHFAAYQAAVLEDIGRDMEEDAHPRPRAGAREMAMATTQADIPREEAVDAYS